MAQAGVYAPSEVIDAEVTVRVNGVVREHVSMDWAGDTTGGLPEQVVSAGTGMRSRTGTIVWAPQDLVEVEPPHPLRQTGGWPPREGDEVVIDATVDTGQGPYSFRRFTGRLGRTTGSLTEGTLTSEITDTLGDILRRDVSIPPMLTGDYGRSYRVAYLAFEQAGLGLIPPAAKDSTLHSSPQGGISPVVGGGTGRAPDGPWSESGDPHGFSAWSNLLTYADGRARGSRAVLVTARGSSIWDTTVTVRLTNGTLLSLEFARSTHTLTLRQGSTVIRTEDYVGPEGIPVLAFKFTGSDVRLWTGINTSVRFDRSMPTAGVDAAWGTRLSAVDVSYVSTSITGAELVSRTPAWPVAMERSRLEQERVPATRSVENVPARSVVDAWSEATLASVWMDEHGHALCVGRDRLLDRPVSRAMRVDERVLAGSWSVGDDSVRSLVTVKGQESALQNSNPLGGHRVTIWQERSVRSYEAPEVIERFIEAETEVEWGTVDLTVSRWTSSSSVSDDRPADGTWIHAVVNVPVGDGEDEQWAWDVSPPATYSMTVERLGHRTLKLTETVVPGAHGSVYLKSPERKERQSPSWIRSAYRDVPSPIIRAAWITTWTDYVATGTTAGPAWAEPLVHDASWFLGPGDAQRVADALAAEVTEPMPTLSRAEVLWNPTRQIGDVEEWVAVDREGAESWRARVLVTGYSEAWDGDVPSQSVDARVISWTDPLDGKTYGDLAAAYARYSNLSGTYQQVYDALPNSR